MTINVTLENDTVILAPTEKIDFVTAPEVEKAIEANAAAADRMIIDMAQVDYISSAGLRAILFADNLMSEKKGMALKNVNSSVLEILDLSGFSQEVQIL